MLESQFHISLLEEVLKRDVKAEPETGHACRIGKGLWGRVSGSCNKNNMLCFGDASVVDPVIGALPHRSTDSGE